MSGVASNRQIWGRDFPVGGEWDAGATPLLMPACPAGRWTVRRNPENFIVVFHRIADGQETILETFPPTEEGEVDAKNCALAACKTFRSS